MPIAPNNAFFFIIVLIVHFFSSQPAMAQGNGILTITTDPPNASLYIDGQLIGQTPLLKHPLTAGQHTIYLRDQTQQIDYTKIIEISENSETALNVPLQKDYGKLTVTSKPDSSEVFLLTPIGKTPLIDEQIDQGTFTLEIRNPNSRYIPLRKNNIYIDKNNPGVINDPLSRKKIMSSKAWWQLGLGVATAGAYYWSCNRGLYSTHRRQVVPGFVVGTTLLLTIEILALF
ncbi:MAG TPA: PEGA domain-containing protein [Chitinispirillaceae bacterium]|nr:PEGA domain-containing protein [Chitinispirillaceae bacterium]